MANDKPEVWLRGPVENVPGLLQPVAHALLQAREEVNDLLENFPDKLLWEKPAGVASAGFHLQHLTGVLDRLFTYAKGDGLSASQLDKLALEGRPGLQTSLQDLLESFNHQVDESIIELRNAKEETLQEVRGVGRVQIPSNVLGLLVHAAEHTMRHVGQLYVTVKVLMAQERD